MARNHPREATTHGRLYRSRRGWIFGVCRGLAEHLGLNVTAVRALTLLAFLMTGLWPVGIGYIVLALLLKPAPVLPLMSDEDAEFYSSYTGSRKLAIQRLKRSFDNLDRRIQRMEDVVTDRRYDWEQRLNRG